MISLLLSIEQTCPDLPLTCKNLLVQYYETRDFWRLPKLQKLAIWVFRGNLQRLVFDMKQNMPSFVEPLNNSIKLTNVMKRCKNG